MSKIPERPSELVDQTYFQTSKPAQLSINNRVVTDKDTNILPDFEQRIKNYFNASLQRADFKNNAVEETKKVNDWISNATNHKITKIFDKIPEETSFVVLNALYFKGWYSILIEGLSKSGKRSFSR